LLRDGDITTVDRRLLDELTTVVSMASAAILAACAHSLDTRIKVDLSPVTAADRAAEAVILEGLGRLLPGVCVVSEEAAGEAPEAAHRGGRGLGGHLVHYRASSMRLIGPARSVSDSLESEADCILCVWRTFFCEAPHTSVRRTGSHLAGKCASAQLRRGRTR